MAFLSIKAVTTILYKMSAYLYLNDDNNYVLKDIENTEFGLIFAEKWDAFASSNPDMYVKRTAYLPVLGKTEIIIDKHKSASVGKALTVFLTKGVNFVENKLIPITFHTPSFGKKSKIKGHGAHSEQLDILRQVAGDLPSDLYSIEVKSRYSDEPTTYTLINAATKVKSKYRLILLYQFGKLFKNEGLKYGIVQGTDYSRGVVSTSLSSLLDIVSTLDAEDASINTISSDDDDDD